MTSSTRATPIGYTEKAARRFLHGTPHSSPAAAVRAGARSIHEWTDVLAQARAQHLEDLRARQAFRRGRPSAQPARLERVIEVLQAGPLTAAELADFLDATRPTVQKDIDTLLARGRVCRLGAVTRDARLACRYAINDPEAGAP